MVDVSVSKRWSTIQQFKVSIDYEKGSGSFYPVTHQGGQQILLKVEPFAFDSRLSLLSYLTLEFQLLHEYVSHALPVWIDANLEEVLLLAATYRFTPTAIQKTAFARYSLRAVEAARHGHRIRRARP